LIALCLPNSKPSDENELLKLGLKQNLKDTNVYCYQIRSTAVVWKAWFTSIFYFNDPVTVEFGLRIYYTKSQPLTISKVICLETTTKKTKPLKSASKCFNQKCTT